MVSEHRKAQLTLCNMVDMSSQIEKLDKNNYQPWKFRMQNYLIGKNLWGYVLGAIVKLSLPNRGATDKQRETFIQWNKKDKMIIFVFSQNISNPMIGHIQELETSEEVWNCLESLYTSSTKARKIQLKNELNNMKKNPSMSVNDYVLKIKDLIDALASIGSPVDNDDKVAFCLNGLREGDKWKSFITSVYVRDSMLEFDQLVALMVAEEINL